MEDREIKQVPFELKELSDSGEFYGTASPYGVKDLGNDIVERGAFTKTLMERGNKVRLLDNHKVRIGIATVSDAPDGLEAKGKINLDKQAGRDAYSDLKFYQEQGQPMGLSIGYQTIKADPRDTDGVRRLRELKLYEISITEMPMNLEATVTAVKTADEPQMASTGTVEEKVATEPPVEQKAGRMISAANRECIKTACAHMKSAHDLLQALVAEELGETEDDSTSDSGDKAAASPEPVDHSANLNQLLRELKELV